MSIRPYRHGEQESVGVKFMPGADGGMAMQPFTDVDVLDLTQSIAGPLATQQLGALGANVVKVEPPGGDDFRDKLDGAMFTFCNLGAKRSVGVDLKTEAGREVVQELAAEADVVVESFRPGMLARFGLDYESVCGDNPNVVYCSITGFGQDGPYRDRPAYDAVLQAMSGMISTTGYPDRPPVRAGTSVVDCGTGMTAAFSIAAALLERRRTGEGEYLDVSLFEVALSWMGYWIANYSGTGQVPGRSQPGGFAGLSPYGVFEARNGEQCYVAVVNDQQFQRLCDALDLGSLADDDRFVEAGARWDHRGELYDRLSAEFDDRDRDEVVERLVDAGVPAGPLQTVDEVVADAHVDTRDVLVGVENVHREETVETPGIPLVTGDGRPDPGGRPPHFGEHTRAVLSELGYTETQIDRMLAAGELEAR